MKNQASEKRGSRRDSPSVRDREEDLTDKFTSSVHDGRRGCPRRADAPLPNPMTAGWVLDR